VAHRSHRSRETACRPITATASPDCTRTPSRVTAIGITPAAVRAVVLVSARTGPWPIRPDWSSLNPARCSMTTRCATHLVHASFEPGFYRCSWRADSPLWSGRGGSLIRGLATGKAAAETSGRATRGRGSVRELLVPTGGWGAGRSSAALFRNAVLQTWPRHQCRTSSVAGGIGQCDDRQGRRRQSEEDAGCRSS
jgi:hypothetical protein